MKRALVSLIVLTLMIAGAATSALGQGHSKHPTLFERLGGKDGIGKIFDETGKRMAADPLLADMFKGGNAEMAALQRERTVELLCQESGGPCKYRGPTVKDAHTPLHINEAQWKAFIKHLGEAMDELKVGEKDKHDMVAVAERFKNDIVMKPHR